MTILKLKKQLDKLIAKGHGNKVVCVDKKRVTHPLVSSGARFLRVTSAELDSHRMMDKEGKPKQKADGQAVTRVALVITAEH